MANFQFTLALLALGVLGALSASVPVKKLSFKTPGASGPKNDSLGMYKGKTSSIKKHPYLVGILYEGSFSSAGTIISDNYVILSGDSAAGVDASSFTVVAGSKDGISGKKYEVEEVTVHPNYGPTFLDYDFALLKIKGKFKWSATVKKAKLPKGKAKAGSKTVVAGWGDTSSDGTLQQGSMKFISNAQCQKIYTSLGLTMTARMGCAYNKGKTTLCQNDWADPFIQKGAIQQLFIAIGTDGECSKEALPVINADVFSVKSWIKSVTGIEEDEDEEMAEEDEEDEEEEGDDEEEDNIEEEDDEQKEELSQSS